MAAKRNRHKQVKGTSERLLESAAAARAQAALLPPGPLQRDLLQKAQEAESTAHMNDWLTSPGLRPPR